MFSLKLIFLFSSVIVLVSAIRQKLTLYESNDDLGDGVILKEHYSDLSAACFASRTNYLCSTGMWALYAEAGFTLHNNNRIYTSESRTCQASVDANGYTSVRYLGAPDTDTVGLSTYDGEWVTGTARLYTSVASSGTPYPLKSLAMTGWSNWTLYTGEDFTGMGYCLRSTAQTHLVTVLDNNYPQSIGSVLRGCDDNVANEILVH